ncbi:DUF475 domain-containing protein [Candidatus Parcubacteria bacterium]|nr:DUF475 domain-containing protein [Candidatus Parcubacteria bacterium]
MDRIFFFPILIALVTLAAVYLWGGLQALILAAILSVLEVTLSFDNAVVNAKVLKKMDETWQRRFLTWGILIAVFGTRLVLPILIVSAVVWLSPLAVLGLVLYDSAHYAELLEQVHPAISSFGGAFLLMVALKYFFDEAKEIHWIRMIEKRLAGWGRIEAVEIALALVILVTLASVSTVPAVILSAGIIGIVLFILVEGLANSLGSGSSLVAGTGLSLFLYLNVLDSAFSLDGVIGAFALTVQLPIIVAGLGIGAYFVRSMTVYLVRNKTLDNLIYLEHGAHWAILGLALSMFAGLLIHVPEIIIGSIGLFFVLLAYVSSRRERAQAS